MAIANIFGNGPETQAERMLVVHRDRCPQNHLCPSVKICPTGALTQDGVHAPAADTERCIRCGKCVRFCPMQALTLEPSTEKEK